MIKELNKLSGKVIRFYFRDAPGAQFGKLLGADDIGIAVFEDMDPTKMRQFIHWDRLIQVDYFPKDSDSDQ